MKSSTQLSRDHLFNIHANRTEQKRCLLPRPNPHVRLHLPTGFSPVLLYSGYKSAFESNYQPWSFYCVSGAWHILSQTLPGTLQGVGRMFLMWSRFASLTQVQKGR